MRQTLDISPAESSAEQIATGGCASGAVGYVVAAALSTGDIAVIEGRPSRILDEPQTFHRGWSLFDELEILVCITVCPVGGVMPRRVILRPDHRLELVRKAGEATSSLDGWATGCA